MRNCDDARMVSYVSMVRRVFVGPAELFRVWIAMSFVKRYWIAGLVMVLVVIHAIIIGYVRAEASRVRIAATNEIPIGVYYVQSLDNRWLTQLRVHLLVRPERRLEAKSTIEQNRWLIHEVIEEKLRQLDPTLLHDAVLLKVKEEIKTALDERMHEEVIEQVLVNDRIVIPANRFEYPMPHNAVEPEALYTSVSKEEVHVNDASHNLMAAQGEHADHAEESSGGHGAPAGDGHGASAHAEGHGDPVDDSAKVDFSIAPSGAEYSGVQEAPAPTADAHGGGHGGGKASSGHGGGH